jgi:hypothetical protein
MDDRIWDATVFTKNRDRLVKGDIALRFFEQVLAEARERGLTCDEPATARSMGGRPGISPTR